MIKVNNISFIQTRISLLANYKYQNKNEDFIDIFNKYKSNQIGNPTIEKGISLFIKERKLDTDELFLSKGILTNESKDLIEITVISYNDVYYIPKYDIIEKTTDVKYKGAPANGYQSRLNNYKRYAKETGVEFELVKIHEMGFAVDAPSLTGDLIKTDHSYEIDMRDFIINDDRNQIINETKYAARAIIENELPNYLVIKGDCLYAKQSSRELINYIENILSTNTYFQYAKNNLEIADEIIYFDSYDVFERIVVDYLINHLRKNVIPLKEIENMIDVIFSIEGIQVEGRLHVSNITSKLDKEIEKDKEASRNYYFAKDILENSLNVVASTTHLKDKHGPLNDLLIDILKINARTRKVYIASQYLLMKYFSTDKDVKNDKKNRIITALIDIAKRFDFELYIIAKTKRQTDAFHIIQSDFNNVHGRYIVTIGEQKNILKFDAELDHFDEINDVIVSFKDISYMHLKDASLLPISIRRVVGDLQ